MNKAYIVNGKTLHPDMKALLERLDRLQPGAVAAASNRHEGRGQGFIIVARNSAGKDLHTRERYGSRTLRHLLPWRRVYEGRPR